MIIDKELSFDVDYINDKDSALKKISEIISKKFSVNQKEIYTNLVKREEQFSTGLGDGVSIPHTVVEGLNEVKVVFLRYKNEIDWGSIDNKKVKFSIAIFAPKDGRDDHFEVLTKISKELSNPKNINFLKKEKLIKIVNFINDSINKKEKIYDKKNNFNSYDIVAITACPTGIAHTFMAAESLKKAAEELNLTIKVETQGQRTDNLLTQKEIDEAKGIIFAIDRNIDKNRFNNKHVVETTTKNAIKNSVNLINKSLMVDPKEKTLIKSTGNSNSTKTNELNAEMTFNNFSKRLWKSLMNGVSYMLPFVVFGGIMISLSFLIDISSAGEPNYGSVNPFASWFNGIGGLSMGMIVPILTAYIMFAIIGKQGILPGVVLGYIAAGSGPIWVNFIDVNIDWLPDAAFSSDGSLNVVSSGFIGGILFAFVSSIIFIWLSNQFDKVLPSSMNGIKLILLLPFFGTFISASILWFVNIPLTYVTWGLLYILNIMSSPYLIWLMGLVLGAMMAIDMGGPINKTAYLFGVATISSGSSVEMAAVMAAGMTPPLGIALATLFKRDKLWDQEDINSGYTNWALGASFITEGAIPFAAKYPKVIIPSIVLGSAITGLLSALFGVQTLAPHGGLFTIALLTNRWIGDGVGGLSISFAIIGWIFAIAVGTIITSISILYLRNKEVNKTLKSN